MPDADIFIGLDVGSTTVKSVVLNLAGEIIFSKYVRHYSEVQATSSALLKEIATNFESSNFKLCITGSGGISLAKHLQVPFLQEVLASHLAIKKEIPDADCVIELGGEDAKLTFLTGGIEQRMNETCAGGTGAFIDQMGAFLGTDAAGLDRLASKHKTIYPIASRCGVFAKMDILPLLNEGAAKEDLAASVLQAVVNQTVSGLAHGRKIQGKVVFLGGPLVFLPVLRQRFISTLTEIKEPIFPDNGHFFVALGAAYNAKAESAATLTSKELLARLEQDFSENLTAQLPPLFANEQERTRFYARHSKSQLTHMLLEDAKGRAWLGFDSGSTTIKAVLIDDAGQILYEYYASNRGDPLKAALAVLAEIYRRKSDDLVIAGSGATGYGSGLLAQALHLDVDEVETVAHYTAAAFFEPRVSFVLDIGGQDIKCLHVRNEAIDRISLNEACSSGCGSFIENFADSLQIPLKDFVIAALQAKTPVDLGTRCTVFMNSKVKQAQKEGTSVGDIAAGLSYSVIRNACYKVMKIKNVAELGDHVVAQGGAFANDALLRALELELGKNVVRPDSPGLMGALGVALLARRRSKSCAKSNLLSQAELEAFQVTTKVTRCRHCTNACLLTISSFAGGRHYISGNRCERGARQTAAVSPNMYAWKYSRLFDYYKPLENPTRGTIGIPRALNVYENYPLWFTLLTELGFRVELSSPSSKKLYYQGYATIPSQTVCYPAKLAHGHILDLIERGIKTIFFPCVPREEKPKQLTSGDFNCPVVAGYPELLRNNISALREQGIRYSCPFLPISRTMLAQRLHEDKLFADISLEELENAVKTAFAAFDKYHQDVRDMGQKIYEEIWAKKQKCIVLAGHPYHIDPEVHHGIADFIASLGMAVITEDALAYDQDDPKEIRVVNQWAYHSRLYRAGSFAINHPGLAVLQLFSFGCGLDAITSDQLEEIVSSGGSLYAQIKLDEGTNLGPARIRIRSLLATMQERGGKKNCLAPSLLNVPPNFTDKMRETHTLLIPQMSPLHFEFMEAVFHASGYKAKLLPKVDHAAIELGLRYVNNDACFPAIVVIGQLLQAVQSPEYANKKVALLISQTGGGCRATNYVSLLKKAMIDAGLAHIPILALATGLQGPGLRMTRGMLFRMIMAGHYGDALARMINRVRPYERDPGSVDALKEKWLSRARENIISGNILKFEWNMFRMIRDFDQLPLRDEKRRQRVGIVGEILLKYHPDANNNAAEVIESEGGEVVSTDIMDFALYCLYDDVFNYRHLAGPKRDARMAMLGIAFLELSRLGMRLAFKLSSRFFAPTTFRQLRKKTSNLISLGQQSGEGWLLGAEMVRMLESGVENILCVQPFGCLPNHVVAKGLMGELKRRYPKANFISLDYDPGASEVNQINRIKLMMRSGRLGQE
ncbi:MAG: 2-hydroxyacyl-CoA dehydratase [Desulfovibrionaceae bacterium]|nr:2-hydroxyacyl-CoA dehydratase [Desulfovibrionaceae bacterium]